MNRMEPETSLNDEQEQDLKALKKEIEIYAQYLPKIRPLRSFIHDHMFPKLLNQDSLTALIKLEEIYGWKTFLPKKIWENELTKCTPLLPDETELKFFEKPPKPIHEIINQLIKIPLVELTEPILIRFLSSYFDQGIQEIKPITFKKGLWSSFRSTLQNSWLLLKPFHRMDIKNLPLLAEKQILIFMNDYIPTSLRSDYLKECLFSLRGWAGFIYYIEHHPHLLPKPRACSVIDYLAIYLSVERAWLKNYFPHSQDLKNILIEYEKAKASNSKEQSLNEKSHLDPQLDCESQLQEVDTKQAKIPKLQITSHNEELLKIQWQVQQAMEDEHLKKYLVPLKAHLKKNENKNSESSYLFLFCIDDRECVLRRHIEATNPKCLTFGYPGFFGFEFYFQRHTHELPLKHCPDPIQTKKVIRLEVGDLSPVYPLLYNGWWQKILHFWYPPKTPPSSVILSSKIQLNSKEVFSLEEATLRCKNVLSPMGLKKIDAPIVIVMGHQSTTANNPYYNAYGCGACSGGSGAINSTVFCEFMNEKTVRELLQRYHNITINEKTCFIPAVHDTTVDTITLFLDSNQESLPTDLLETLEKALHQTRVERISDFYGDPRLPENLDKIKSDPEKLKAFFWKKGYHPFEVRPEYLHTNATFCFIGRRSLIRDFSFERMAFLQSYDPINDTQGDWLAELLSMIVPVCGGINLDYFFSRHNAQLGAGTKLSHNILGLIGVTNGTEDDLLPGLASQMTERHKPCRISFLIEASPELIEKAICQNSRIKAYFDHQWCRLISISSVDLWERVSLPKVSMSSVNFASSNSDSTFIWQRMDL